MGIKIKKNSPSPKKGRTKKFGENISVTVWKNQKAFCTICSSYKQARFKITLKKPMGPGSFKLVFYNSEHFVCSKKCRTMFLLQNI